MKPVRVVVVLVALQAVLVGVYLGVEALRGKEEAPFRWEVLDEEVPGLQVIRAGAAVPLPQGDYVVHFWATWCAPCREELPILLREAEAAGVPLLAVTDEPWPAVARFFGGEVPGSVVQDPGGTAAASWQVSGLPDTFVVRGERVVGRMGGPRDWSTAEARVLLRELGK